MPRALCHVGENATHVPLPLLGCDIHWARFVGARFPFDRRDSCNVQRVNAIHSGRTDVKTWYELTTGKVADFPDRAEFINAQSSRSQTWTIA